MFERRLKVFLAIPVLIGVLVVARLYQLQIVRGESYLEKVDAALVAPRQFLPPLRGRILGRFGRTLVSDEPAYAVTVHYGVLCMDEAYLLRLAGRIKRHETAWQTAAPSTLAVEVRRRIEQMWLTLACGSDTPMREVRLRRDRICDSVERLRRHIWQARRRRGFEEPLNKLRLKEEELFHPVLRDVSPQVRTRIELELSGMPFVRVEPSVRRVWAPSAEPLCHVLGRLGQVSAEVIRGDPNRDDPLACYRAGDEIGTTGVERLAEAVLHGRRGFEERTLDGRLKTRVSPVDGHNVRLAIDLDLQRDISARLSEAVAEHASSTGASCVVIDVASREILALVSVPSETPKRQGAETLLAVSCEPSASSSAKGTAFTEGGSGRNYTALRDDTRYRPLLFRAVQEEYQPGSILKPVALLAGFYYGLVDPQRPVTCEGQLIPGVNKWHCWTHWRGMPGHGPIAAEEAIQHSCNVYFYTLGERINAERLTNFYRGFMGEESRKSKDESRKLKDEVLLAASPRLSTFQPRGTGLIEERPGLIPTKAWMGKHRKRSFRPADGRNYAIGQGEIQITPLQAANLFATLATGHYRDPTLIADDPRPRPILPIGGLSEEAWSLVRRGLYRCVNEPGGSAYKYARLDGLEICGKTGSAQCVPRVTQWRYSFAETPKRQNAETPKQVTRSVVAPTVEAARERLGLGRGVRPIKREVAETWPPPDPESGKIPTHAWFAGFAPYHNPRIALAVVIEYGGSGGRTAGPVGRAVFELLRSSPHGYLNDE